MKSVRLAAYAMSFVASCLSVPAAPSIEGARERHLLYVAVPGIWNYVEHGGVGILVFDIADGHRFVKRIPTFEITDGQAPENIKGIAASVKTGRLYVSTPQRLVAL